MRIGQTSVVWFSSKVLSSLLGFITTVYFARVLGAEALGIYSLGIAVAAWVQLPTTMGIGGAIAKRISEGEEEAAYTGAGAVSLILLLIPVIFILLIFHEYLNNYVGIQATVFVIGIVIVNTISTYLLSVLKGKNLVHITGVLSPIEVAGRSVFQLALVVVGFGVSGMFAGNIIGTVVMVLGGLRVVGFQLERPRYKHFKSLFSYARFAWLSSVRSKVFNWIDVLILGFFVSSDLIGIYSVAWTLSSFLGLFSTAIRSSVFPEVSRISAQEDLGQVSGLVETSLSYTGLILIPGFIGSLLVGDRILRIYGKEFVAGSSILVLLIFAYLLHSYGKQAINILNGIDRPELAFRVSAVFLLTNISFNIVLVYLYGWIGAAVATVLSVASGLILSIFYLRRLIEFKIPIEFITRQWIAALLMGGVVFMIRELERSHQVIPGNLLTLLVLVGLGAGVYFVTLSAISKQFRETVQDNAPDILTRGEGE